MRLTTTVFGVTHLSTRMPALLGAFVYLLACATISRLLFSAVIWQCLQFVVLTCNPFVLDYLVAARGYSLAMAFLAWQLVIVFVILLQRSQAVRRNELHYGAACSAFAGLSFAANFSFAFVNASVLCVALLLLLPSPFPARNLDLVLRKLKVVAAIVLPGLAVTGFLCASVLIDWRNVEFMYGARSFEEMCKSIFESSFYQLSPHIVNPVLRQYLENLPSPLLWTLFWAGLIHGVLLIVTADSWRGALHEKALSFAALLSGVLGATILAHSVLHYGFGVLLPMERTVLFVPLLLALIAGCLAAASGRSPRSSTASRVPGYSGGVLRGLLATVAVYFLLCGRLTYFKEWKYDADTRAVYDVLAYHYHRYGVDDVPSSWLYTASLNYYSAASGREAFREFVSVRPYPTGRRVYVLFWPDDEEFINRQNLQVVYRGPLSDVVVAVRPDLLQSGQSMSGSRYPFKDSTVHPASLSGRGQPSQPPRGSPPA